MSYWKLYSVLLIYFKWFYMCFHLWDHRCVCDLALLFSVTWPFQARVKNFDNPKLYTSMMNGGN
jgi:hypothetical protein